MDLGDGSWLPYVPNQVTDHLVVTGLAEDASLLASLSRLLDDERCRYAVTSAAQLSAAHSEAASAIAKMVAADPARLLPFAVDAALALANPALDVLLEFAVASFDWSYLDVGRLHGRILVHTESLPRTAAALAQARMDRAPEGPCLAGALQNLGRPAGSAGPPRAGAGSGGGGGHPLAGAGRGAPRRPRPRPSPRPAESGGQPSTPT